MFYVSNYQQVVEVTFKSSQITVKKERKKQKLFAMLFRIPSKVWRVQRTSHRYRMRAISTRQSKPMRWIATKALKPIISSVMWYTSQSFFFITVFPFRQHISHAKMPLNLFVTKCVVSILQRRERKSQPNVFLCDCMLFSVRLFFFVSFSSHREFSISTKVDTFVVIIDHKTKLNRI